MLADLITGMIANAAATQAFRSEQWDYYPEARIGKRMTKAEADIAYGFYNRWWSQFTAEEIEARDLI